MAAEGHWGAARLEAEIRKRLGRRRKGGRRRHIPAQTDDLLTQVEGECDSWRRWYKALENGKAGHAHLQDLPRAVRRRLTQANKAVVALQEAAEKEPQQRRHRRGSQADSRSSSSP